MKILRFKNNIVKQNYQKKVVTAQQNLKYESWAIKSQIRQQMAAQLYCPQDNFLSNP